jgi:hypothetical protein
MWSQNSLAVGSESTILLVSTIYVILLRQSTITRIELYLNNISRPIIKSMLMESYQYYETSSGFKNLYGIWPASFILIPISQFYIYHTMLLYMCSYQKSLVTSL